MPSLITMLTKSQFGLKGTKPFFKIIPTPPGSYHKTYSVDGAPKISVLGINPVHSIPMPSRLDEWDSNNKNKLKSRRFIGKTYLDNPPH